MECQIKEFHYIAPLDNLESIFERGILSHKNAEPFKKADISMDGVQKIRATKELPSPLCPQGTRIHDCANLYFNAKNPMLFVRQNVHESLCVIRIRPEAMHIDGAIISDRNAAAADARFYFVAQGITRLVQNILFGDSWTFKHLSEEESKRNGQFRSAELLIHGNLHPSYIGGIYVSSESVLFRIQTIFKGQCPVPVDLHPTFFFLKSPSQTRISVLSNATFPQLINFVAEKVAAVSKPQLKPKPAPKRPVDPQQGTITQFYKQIKRIKPEEEEIPKPAEPAKIYNFSKKGMDGFVKQNPLVLPHNMRILEGNIMDSQMQTLVNTVNCKGIMGKGIALVIKNRYGALFDDYKDRCARGEVKPGVPYLYKIHDGRLVINFPTKDDWKKKSKLEWIEKGLNFLVDHAHVWGVTSLALPALGCGNGQLVWSIVRSMMVKKLGALNIPIEIYNPSKK